MKFVFKEISIATLHNAIFSHGELISSYEMKFLRRTHGNNIVNITL